MVVKCIYFMRATIKPKWHRIIGKCVRLTPIPSGFFFRWGGKEIPGEKRGMGRSHNLWTMKFLHSTHGFIRYKPWTKGNGILPIHNSKYCQCLPWIGSVFPMHHWKKLTSSSLRNTSIVWWNILLIVQFTTVKWFAYKCTPKQLFTIITESYIKSPVLQ